MFWSLGGIYLDLTQVFGYIALLFPIIYGLVKYVYHVTWGEQSGCKISAQAHTSVELSYLVGVMDEVVKYQSGRCLWWRASLVRNSWVITSVASAVFLL
jgi:hypothetical protein